MYNVSFFINIANYINSSLVLWCYSWALLSDQENVDSLEATFTLKKIKKYTRNFITECSVTLILPCNMQQGRIMHFHAQRGYVQKSLHLTWLPLPFVLAYITPILTIFFQSRFLTIPFWTFMLRAFYLSNWYEKISKLYHCCCCSQPRRSTPQSPDKELTPKDDRFVQFIGWVLWFLNSVKACA